MFVGLAKITSPMKGNIHRIVYNQFSTNTTNVPGYILYVPSTSSITLELFGMNFQFTQKRSLTVDNYYTPMKAIIPTFQTTPTTLMNTICPNGKKLCKIQFGSNTTSDCCAPSSFINSDGSCMISSGNNSDICYLNDPNPSQGDIMISKCSSNINIIQNNIDFMMNQFFTQKNGGGNILSCEYTNILTKWDQYIILYAKDTKNMSTFGYQIWGLEPNENKVITKSSKVANLISNKIQQNPEIIQSLKKSFNEPNSSISTDMISTNTVSTNDYPQLWKFTKSYQQGSCYLTLQTIKSNSQPTYYLNYKRDGDLFMTLQSGGFQQFLALDQFYTVFENSSNKYGIYTGYMKTLQNFYISPGRPDHQDMDPFSSANVKVCNLVSKMNQPGKWIIIGFNGNLQDIIQDLSISKSIS